MAGGDRGNPWRWHVDTLIGVPFAGHPMDPQLQDAWIAVEDKSELTQGLPSHWTMRDE